MDHLECAKNILGEIPTIKQLSSRDGTFLLIGAATHALIALCERLDAVTGTPANSQGKAIRVLNKDA